MMNFHFGTSTVLSILFIIINHSHSTTAQNNDELFHINITMNNFQTTQEDQYAFVQYKLPDEELMIVGYSPLINMNSAHHMLTYACGSPGSNNPSWTGGGPCGSIQMIIHGWGRNAPTMILPEGVGFAVGRNTPYKYVVVNIHYLSILKNDNSGNQLIMSRQKRKYHAGVLLAATGQIYLKPKTHTVRTPFSCRYSGAPISIFAARVHAHQWARVNSLYRVRDGVISQVVKGNPQWPQSFYPLPTPVDIQDGDFIVGQCVYDNNDDRVVQVGSTHNDEMCNVYAMFSYEPPKDGQKMPMQSCWGNMDNKMASLIPPDSEVPPLKPADIGDSNVAHYGHAEHAMQSPPAKLYTSVEKWPEVKSLPAELGQIGGIALNNGNNELVVFHRGSRAWEYKYFENYRFRNEAFGPIAEDVLLHVDTQTGQVKSHWGAKMFYMPHGLTIDHEGNFWLTDIAMHQVFMFKPNDLTHPALTVGELFQSGAGPNQFCRPADIAVMKNGDFFVADGYCNNRIVKFNRKGEYVAEWGSPMTGNRDSDGFTMPNQWNIVHSIALNEDAQLVCVADRENFRIQCFNSNTREFLRQIRVEKKDTMGAIYAIEFAPNTNGSILFAVTGGAQTSNKKVYMIDAQNGDILTSFDSNPHLISPHDITVSANGREIYVGELATSPASALHKFELPKQKEKELPTKTFTKESYVNNKNFRISLIIIISFAVPILIAVIIGCIIRIRNIRKLNRLNTFLSDVKNTGNNRGSVLGDWMNRRKGFDQLIQYSDGENEPFDISAGDNSGDERISANNKTNHVTFKMATNL